MSLQFALPVIGCGVIQFHQTNLFHWNISSKNQLESFLGMCEKIAPLLLNMAHFFPGLRALKQYLIVTPWKSMKIIRWNPVQLEVWMVHPWVFR